MPGRDGTGPGGYGPEGGRQLGGCLSGERGVPRARWGIGRGRGFGYGRRRCLATPVSPQEERGFLARQKDILEQNLNLVKQRLDALSDNQT